MTNLVPETSTSRYDVESEEGSINRCVTTCSPAALLNWVNVAYLGRRVLVVSFSTVLCVQFVMV